MGKSGNSVMSPTRGHTQGGMTRGQSGLRVGGTEFESLKTELRNWTNENAGRDARTRNRVQTAIREKKLVSESDIKTMTDNLSNGRRINVVQKFDRWNQLVALAVHHGGAS